MVDAKRGKNLYERVTVGLGFTFRLDEKVATILANHFAW